MMQTPESLRRGDGGSTIGRNTENRIFFWAKSRARAFLPGSWAPAIVIDDLQQPG